MSMKTTGARLSYPLLRWLLLGLLLAMLVLLTLRTCFGPIPGLISARTTLNFCAIAFLALIALASLNRSLPQSSSREIRSRNWIALPAIGAIAFLAYLPSIPAPFLFDDYTHLAMARSETLPALLRRALLLHPLGGDLFFRPVGSLYYWSFYRLAGVNPVPWHLANVILHVLNAILVYLLARRLSIPAHPALFGTAFFAWTGVHVEDVCWVAAVFDLLATFFVLLALLECLRPRAGINIVIFSALACLSKESAYCLPLLVLCLALFRARSERLPLFRKAILTSVACAAVFIYQLWYVRGLGGYRNAGGQSQVFSLHLVSTFQALFLRTWGIFFLPVNWSVSTELWLKIATAVLLICVGALAFRMRRTATGPAILFVLCAALPVVPLLLIGSDLSGARVLYLPSVGISLLWMQLWSTQKDRTLCLIASGVLLFQLAALWHNETVWVQVAQTARRACIGTANLLQQNPGRSVAAQYLPKTLDGVFFLQNGFPQCVAINGEVDASRVRPNKPPDTQTIKIYWNPKTDQLQPH